MNKCQLIILSVIIAVSADEKPWTGPFADHILGQLVGDTPEVAAAKRQHAEAHSQVRAILPVLPQEEEEDQRFSDVPGPVIVPQHHAGIPHHVHHLAPLTQAQPQFVQYAEEIPRSTIGEVPEVDAARQAHLRAFMEAKARLPQLRTVELSTVASPVQDLVGWSGPGDTPEVAYAKLQHARARAALLGH